MCNFAPRSGFNFRNKRIPTNVCVWRDSCCCSRRHAKRPCEAFCAPDRRTGDESTGPKRVWDRSNDAGGLLSIMPPATRSGKPSGSLTVCPRQVCDGSEQQKKKILIINNNTLKPSRFLVHQDLVIAHFAAVAPLPLFARLTRQPFSLCVCVFAIPGVRASWPVVCVLERARASSHHLILSVSVFKRFFASFFN